jgi:hypothetical protein
MAGSSKCAATAWYTPLAQSIDAVGRLQSDACTLQQQKECAPNLHTMQSFK